jgi:GPH family glycoside/pentoside/hexuronide:cation symporter
VWAVGIIAPCFITFFGTREPDYATQAGPKGLGLFEGLRIAFGNQAFILVTVIYLLSWLTIQFVANNLFIYVKDWIGMAANQFGFVLLAIQLSSFVWVLIWARVSERIGKKSVYYVGALVFMLVLLGLFFVQPGQSGLVYVLGVLAGIGVAVGYLVPWSMMPDVIEMDELVTGQRREGVFYGFFVFLQKLGLSLGLFISGQVLEAAGYINSIPGQPAPVQPASVLLALRLLVGPAGAAILLLSFIAVYLYPITKEKHTQIRAQLAARKAIR